MNDVQQIEQNFLENYRKKLIKQFIKTIHKNYKIYNDSDDIVSEKELEQLFLKPKIIKRCIGTTNTTPIMQCSRNAIENGDYCKTHVYKMGIIKQNKPEVSFEFKMIKNNNNTVNLENKHLIKKFIEDSFYLIDNKYIYNPETMTKVGYIDNNEYILTSDPFILEII
jgi:hypothetical protein